MDIKSKNNKILVNIIIVATVLIAAVGMCLTYPKIAKDSEKFKYNIFESHSGIYEDINKINYTLYYDMYKDEKNKQLNPSDILVEINNVNNNQSDENYNKFTSVEEYDNFKDTFDNEIYSWYDNLVNVSSNLKYYALNKDTEEVKKNTNIPTEGDDLYENIKNNYRFYMVLDYDENGNLSVEKVYGADKFAVSNKIHKLQRENLNNNFDYSRYFEMKPIKNMKYIYAVPKNLVTYENYSDSVYYANNNMEYSAYSRASYLFINIALIFVVFVSLFIPYKELIKVKLFNKILNLPIEIITLVVLMAITFIYCSTEVIIISSIQGELLKNIQLQLSKEAINGLVYLINGVYWALCFSIIVVGVNAIKHIFSNGFFKYIKNNSLIYKLISYIGNKVKRFYNWSTSIDLKDKNGKKIMIILGINLILVIIMCCMWMFGIIAAIIYTIGLFIIIKKRYTKVSIDYNNLLKKTNEIAKGNLDVSVEEDLGVFNSLKDEITNIQIGFKKAVDEEVKSQKMKTELISNVSHDLKTPLTSIITYVDLLKDENLPKDKREQYLDTLDKKSQRLQALIEDLFEVSKASSGNISLNIVDVDVVSLIKQTLLELDDKVKEQSLIVKTNLSKEKVILSLDSQRMFRVFENLIINITKYAMPKSRVYIDIEEKENKVEVSLKNMAAEEITFNIEEIAERFVRGDKSRNTEGSGLGLAIAKSFVELQGGKFDIIVDGDLFKVIITFNK
ncbi:histidine kinase dimerization/phospho-acceptor domain-containing protein [Romboutsia sp.]|uniref:histidine kinase dimerization/phospho-acceptor domain-containing protein n=1 Tax=Romboutsia sp. TaxID=1965302 RepID=UPI003F36D432